jgi:amidase
MDERELAFAGVAGQAELIRRGEVSAREVVETALRRIERLDRELNAFRSVYFEQAVEDAKRAQRRLRAREPPPLLGVPVAIKDNADVAGDVTTHGTSAYGAPANEDAEVVRRIREAGAIIVGKTNLPPLASMSCTESHAFGVTRNPWNIDRSPGGSSGGSAAAVASAMVPAALGSDGAGSIRVPAAFCGIFGLKPQRGRISLAPLPEHWHGMSVFGWLARDVRDTALLFDLTVGATEVDRHRPPPPARPLSDAARSSPGRLRVAYSLAVPPGPPLMRPDAEVRAALLETVEVLESLGHEVREHDPSYGAAFIGSLIRVAHGVAEEARTLPRWERLERRMRTWTRLAEATIPKPTLRWALRQEEANAARINRIFDEAEVLLTPVTSEAPIEIGRWEGRGVVWLLNGNARLIPWPNIWNQTGQPAAAVPAGLDSEGLPRSVMLVGRPYDEHTIVSLAAQLEAERGWPNWRPPVS